MLFMRNRSVFLCIAMIAMAVSCAREPLPEEEVQQTAGESVYVPGEIIVLFSDEMTGLIEADLASGGVVTKSSELNAVTESLGVKSLRRMFPHAGKYEERTRHVGLHKWYVVEYDPNIVRTKASEDLAAIPGVELVEPVFKMKNTAVFDDPMLPKQWHYYNDGKLSSDHKAGADINVVPVWENYTTGSQNVVVGVVDGGVDQDHEDLKANLIGGKNYVTGGKIKPHDHGTHVAGTIAAVNNNGLGVSGIAGGDAKKGVGGVKIWSAQVFEHDTKDPTKDLAASDFYAAMKESADYGAVISQNSWGTAFETKADMEEAKKHGVPGYAKSSIDYFIMYAGCTESKTPVQRDDSPMMGGVVIFAAGNDGWDWGSPCSYDPVIAVGSIAPDYTRAYYSNYGDWVDIAAPGGSVNHGEGMIISTMPGNKYGGMQGTSMACPHVSGVAALLVSYYGGKGFTNEMLVEKLLNGANSKVLSKNAQIGPLLDAMGAFAYGSVTPPEKVPSTTDAVASNNVTLEFKVTTDRDDRKAYGFMAVAAKDKALLNNLDFKNLPAGVASATVLTGDKKVNDVISVTLGDLDFNSVYYAGVTAFDYNRNFSELSPVVTVTTLSNNPPVIKPDHEGELGVKAHETKTVVYEIADPDGHEITVTCKTGSKSATWAQLPDGRYALTVVGNIADPGVYEAEVIAADKYGAEQKSVLKYQIFENAAPAVIKELEDMIMTSAGEKFQIDMAEYISDPDGEQLKFSVSITDRTVLHINPNGNILNATTLDYGLTDVIITASDSKGLKCSLTFKVLVKDPENLLEIFPNPVVDVLNIRTGDIVETYVKITSSTGKAVYEETSMIGAMAPAEIDMTKCAPGMYAVDIVFDGKSYKEFIVKL